MASDKFDLLRTMRVVEDYPQKGVSFKDITTMLLDDSALHRTIKALADHFREAKVTKVCGLESRGFMFGVAVAYELGVGFIPARKAGKLPCEVVSEDYTLEYGTNTLEMHKDAVTSGDNVLIIDDLIATGGSARAAANLVERLGGKVAGLGFVIELEGLNGRQQLKDYDVYSLIIYQLGDTEPEGIIGKARSSR